MGYILVPNGASVVCNVLLQVDITHAPLGKSFESISLVTLSDFVSCLRMIIDAVRTIKDFRLHE